jgi:two-component system, NarL family, sensor histidine kinase DegS
VRTHPYTREQMDVREGTELRDGRFDGLHAEAKAALAYTGNTLRAVFEQYREAYRAEFARWQSLRDQLDVLERGLRLPRASGDLAGQAEQDAGDLHLGEVRTEMERLSAELGRHQTELNRLELAQHTLENTWLFLERGDGTLITSQVEPVLPADLQLRIVEAQENERARLAQEVHDGPAQALSNAIFQVEYIERVLDDDPRLAQTELRFLRQLLRRELGDVRSFISQLRPRSLDQLGLAGSIRETVDHMAALTGVPIQMDLQAPGDRLSDPEQTVVLRLVQEALQNVRKHAAAQQASVSSRVEDRDWILEVRDDGRGFDVDTVAARGRRNFGLQFMRERAELIGARFEVRSRPSGGTVVWLAIPMREENR